MAQVPRAYPETQPPAAAATPWAAVLAITAVAAALRLYRLDHGGLWYDELIMARLTAGPWAPLWQDIWQQGRPPVYPLLAWAAGRVLGQSDAALRLLSVLAGTAAVPALFAVARRLFNQRVALLAAALLAVSPYQVYYSQEHRYYALLLLLGTLMLGWLLRAWRFGEPATTRIRGRRWGSWIAYVATAALLFYTHPIAALLLLSLGLAGVGLLLGRGITWRQGRAFLMSQVVILLLMMLWGLFPWVHGAPLLGEEDADLAQAVGIQPTPPPIDTTTPPDTLQLARGSRIDNAATGEAEVAREGNEGGDEGGNEGGGGGGILPWVQTPPWWGPVRTWLNFLFLGKKYVPPAALAVAGGLTLLGVAGAWWCGGVKRPGSRVGNPRQTDGGNDNDSASAAARGAGRAWWVTGWWALGPVLWLAVGAWLWQPIYVDRYVIPASAGLTVLLAAGLVRLSGRRVTDARPVCISTELIANHDLDHTDATPRPASASTHTDHNLAGPAPRRVLPLWVGVTATVLVMGSALVSYYRSPQKGAWPEAAGWVSGRLVAGERLAFASERGDPRESLHVRENWLWYAPTQRTRAVGLVQMQLPPRDIARQLRRLIRSPAEATASPDPQAEPDPADASAARDHGQVNAPPALWLVVWRDPDRPLYLEQAFADGPLSGVRLTELRRFFDLTLMRFVADPAPAPRHAE